MKYSVDNDWILTVILRIRTFICEKLWNNYKLNSCEHKF